MDGACPWAAPSCDVAGADLVLPRLHVVTDDAVVGSSDFVDRAAGVVEAGGSRVALHLRGPRTSGRRLFDLAVVLGPIACERGSWMLVNDRVDVALAAGATGVQLGARSLPTAEARALLGPTRVVGVSVHDAPAFAAAARAGADFALVGTVYPSASHPGGAVLGTEGLASLLAAGGGGGTRAADAPALPVLAIGGVRPEHLRGAVRAGAWGVAVVSGVWGAPVPGRAVEEYLEALECVSEARSGHSAEDR